MKLVLIESDVAARRELEETLGESGVSVASFGDPRTAFLFVLGRLEELDGVLVNDDQGWSSWLCQRLEMLAAPLPVAAYCGGQPAAQVRITGGVPWIDPDDPVKSGRGCGRANRMAKVEESLFDSPGRARQG